MTHYDIILYGATGFTGRLVAAYLASHPDSGAFSWAVAGRNPEKLEKLRASLSGGPGAGPGMVTADTADIDSLSSMVSRAHVVLTTAGPYSAYNGRALVKCCVSQNRDYADLSGEYWFQREMIDGFHSEALRTGAKVVLAAGIDSIPSDLGARFAGEQLEESGIAAAHIKALFTDYAGAFSGGTRKAMKAIETILQSDRYDDDYHSDPYLLAPEADVENKEESVAGWDRLRFDPDFRQIGGPFFMAPINARIVRRSLALSNRLPCRYEEGIAAVAWLKAGWLWASRGFGYFVGDPIPFRPKPGQGPPAWLRRAGKFRVLVKAISKTGKSWAMVEVKGRGDPGYGATSKMLAETGLCLLLDRNKLPAKGGVLTPATALGPALQKRLTTAQGGGFMQFRLLEKHAASPDAAQ
jgi:short subunit dehydrogenase-like uncharacterized protein